MSREDTPFVVNLDETPTPTDTQAESSSHILRGNAFLGGAWLDRVVVLLGALALFTTPLQMLRLATSLAEPLRIGIAAGFCLGAWILARFVTCWRAYNFISWLSRFPVWAWALTGVACRLAWIALFPANPSSDGATYLSIAQSWIELGRYPNESSATWPVGYSLFLALWLYVFPSSWIACTTSNVLLFIFGIFGVARLGKALAGPSAGKFAAALFALWPNLIFNSATPEKEMLILALLPWAVFFLLQALNTRRMLPILTCGLIFGAAILVQPSLQFLPPVCAVVLVIVIRSWRHSLMLATALLLGAMTVIAPWTIRNHQVFGRFVLVSTNGGDVLYRANNSWATGGYTERGEVDLSRLDEYERDQTGRHLALEWINKHPSDFARLALEKLVLFMGDDTVGVFNTLKRGEASNDARLYAALKALSNAWWLGVWFALALFAMKLLRSGGKLSPLARAPVWFWLYLLVLHSVFESAGRYHVPMLFVPCVLLAVYVTECHESEKNDSLFGKTGKP
jgi:hypothetical protein